MKRQANLPPISTSLHSSSQIPLYVSLPPPGSTTSASPGSDYMHNPSPRAAMWSPKTRQDRDRMDIDRMDIDTPTSAGFCNSAESASSFVSAFFPQNGHDPFQAAESLTMDYRSISEHIRRHRNSHALPRSHTRSQSQSHSRSRSHSHFHSFSQPQSPVRSSLNHRHIRRSSDSDSTTATESQRRLASFASLSSLEAEYDEESGFAGDFELPLSQEPQSLSPIDRRRLVRALLRDKARTNKGKKSKYSVPVSYISDEGSIKKRWLCLRCGYPASTSGHASRHHNTVHEIDRPFACRLPNCGHGFKRHDNQVQHEKTRHNLDLDVPGFDPDGSQWRRAIAEEEASKHRRNVRRGPNHLRQKSSISSTSSDWYFDRAGMLPRAPVAIAPAPTPAPVPTLASAPVSTTASTKAPSKTSVKASDKTCLAATVNAPVSTSTVASDASAPPTRQDYRHSLVFLCGDDSESSQPSSAPHSVTLPPLAWTPRGSISSHSGDPSHRTHHRQLPSISLSHSSFQGSEYELSAAETSPAGRNSFCPAEPLGAAPHFQIPNYQQSVSYTQHHHQPATVWASR
ncbi:transcriptional repressor [Ceratocystis pirilliformis]|uniref:Transcriptional repressor n=1 Tax=Ceratocystis pirilliformis TaxID=259994 RepID=A0ABR3ZGR5_9PEZI